MPDDGRGEPALFRKEPVPRTPPAENSDCVWLLAG
jgi:hypothetical protein